MLKTDNYRSFYNKRCYLNLLISGSVILMLNGCSMAPEYVQPILPTATHYPSLPGKPRNSINIKEQSVPQLSWRKFYSQPELQGLIQSALDNNRDLRRAVLNIEQARLMYNVQYNQLLPAISATAGYSKQRTSKEIVSPGLPLITKEYQVGIGITAFEIDLFGRIESLNDEALAAYMAIEETARAAKISLIAAVAHAYLNERSLAAQLSLVNKMVAVGQKVCKLTQQQYDLGNLALDNLKIQQGRLYQYQIQATDLTRLHAQAYNALVMLVGKPVLAKIQTPFAKLLQLNTQCFASLPSDLLLNRPDVIAAEQQLKAANAHIGAARAAFFPRISLTTLLGTASPQLSHLFNSNTRAWSFTPTLTLPIFSWGTDLANLDLAEVRTEIEIAAYEKTIQTAFKEVADTLVARSTFQDQSVYQQGFLNTVTAQLQLIKQKYRHGMLSHLDELSALQELYQSQQAFIQFQQAQMDNAVDLYKVLGGGLR